MPFTWTIVGDGPERGYLERTMVTGNPSQVVRFLGTVAYSRVPALLQEQDVFLLTSDYEGMPATLLEAMGHGLVPVATDLSSGIREVIDPTNGELVGVNDIAGYARAIHRLHQDRNRLAEMSRAAYQRVREQFSVAAMTDEWQALVTRQGPPAGQWSERFKIKRPLVHNFPWTFYEPFRTVRRISKRLTRLR